MGESSHRNPLAHLGCPHRVAPAPPGSLADHGQSRVRPPSVRGAPRGAPRTDGGRTRLWPWSARLPGGAGATRCGHPRCARGFRWEDSPMHPRAGTVALPEDLVALDALTSAYYDRAPDLDDPGQQVVFGTSGHRGSSLDGAFNEAHIVAITAAIVEYRRSRGTDGPLFIGRDPPRAVAPRVADRARGARSCGR